MEHFSARYSLRDFLLANGGQIPEEEEKKLLLYVAFVQRFCQRYRVPYDRTAPLEGLLPRLFREVIGYEIKEAAVNFDAGMPWELLRANPALEDALLRLSDELAQSACATRSWLERQISDLFEVDDVFFGATVTPPTLCTLVARLAAQQPAQQVVDLCCGSFSLGREIWKGQGSLPTVSCKGEDINAYLCAFSCLSLFFCEVDKFSVREQDLMEPDEEIQNCEDAPRIFAADFPLVGSRTFPALKIEQFEEREGASQYADWRMMGALLNRMRLGDRAFMIVTKGALVRRNERALREQLVKNDWLEAVIQLPAGLYTAHNLPMQLLVCKKGRQATRQGKILFSDLSAFAEPGLCRTRRLSEEGIGKLCRAFDSLESQKGFSTVVSAKEIAENGWNLYPPAYLATAEGHDHGASVLLGSVATVTRGLQLPKGCPEVRQNARYLLNVRDLQNGEICCEKAEQMEAGGALWEEKYRIREDDIILTCKGSSLKIAIVPPKPPAAYISGNLMCIRTKPSGYPPYVLYEYLLSEAGQTALNLLQTGTTIRVIGSANLARLKIPAYSPTILAETGRQLKGAALQRRQAMAEIEKNYADQKQRLLARLYAGKEDV